MKIKIQFTTDSISVFYFKEFCLNIEQLFNFGSLQVMAFSVAPVHGKSKCKQDFLVMWGDSYISYQSKRPPFHN